MKEIIARYDQHSTEDDSFEFEDNRYNNFVDDMKNALYEMNVLGRGDVGGWTCVAENARWDGSTGRLETDNAQKLIDALLMDGGKCTTEMWWYGCCKKEIRGVCSHHDVPLGTKFTIKRILK